MSGSGTAEWLHGTSQENAISCAVAHARKLGILKVSTCVATPSGAKAFLEIKISGDQVSVKRAQEPLSRDN